MKRRTGTGMHGGALLAAAAVTLAACGQDANYLEGSLADSYQIDFDRVRVRLYASELSVEYVEDSDAGEKISVRLTLDVVAYPPQTGPTYDLLLAGTVTRGAGYSTAFPPLRSGSLTLTAYGAADGSPVEGRFEAVFDMTDGSQKALRGGFAAPLEAVGL